MKGRSQRSPDAYLAGFCLSLLALALPWEIYQRVPGDLTLVKLSTAGVLISALWRAGVRRRLPQRTGLELPLWALFGVWVLGLMQGGLTTPLRSPDLRLYLGYAVFLYAAQPYLCDPATNRRWVWAFALSAAGVGVLSLACAGGWMWPGAWRPFHFPWHGSLLDVWESGAAMRMAPVSPYINEGAMRFLAALGILLFGFAGGGVRRQCLLWGTGLFLMLAGLAVTQSRTGLLFAAALIAVAAWPYLKRRLGAKRSAALLAGAGVIVLAGAGYFARESLLRDDLSAQSRMAAYQAAIALLPQHLWLGTGLGGSDAAIAASPFAAATGGKTIHSVPLKLLLETGLLGAGALAVFVLAAALLVWRVLSQREDSEALLYRNGLFAAAAAVVLMGAAHPFETHPLYPFLGALALGPVAAARRKENRVEPPPRLTAGAWVGAAAVLIVAVAFNGAAYQRLAGQFARSSRALGQGAQAEWDGSFSHAEVLYRAALDALPSHKGGKPLKDHRFYAEAARLVDMPRQLEEMRVLNRDAGPDAAAQFGLGRCAMSRGKDAVVSLEWAWRRDPTLAEALFVLREALWQQGAYVAAAAWASTGEQAIEAPGNEDFRTFLARLEARLGELEGGGRETWLEKARLLRRLGRYEALVQFLKRAQEQGGFAGFDAAALEALHREAR